MTTIYEVCIASTAPDRQGETLTKADLEAIVRNMPDPMYMGAEHDVGRASQVFGTNLRLRYSAESDTWQVQCDVVVPEGAVFTPHAFSWSSLEPIFDTDTPPAFGAYLPWPQYNDDEALRGLADLNLPLQVGRWRKKSGVSDNALMIALMVVLIQPAWEDLYRRSLAPSLLSLVARLNQTFPGLQHAFVYAAATADDVDYQVRLSHDGAPNYDADLHIRAMRAAHRVVDHLDPPLAPSVVRMTYSPVRQAYGVSSIETSNGILVDGEALQRLIAAARRAERSP